VRRVARASRSKAQDLAIRTPGPRPRSANQAARLSGPAAFQAVFRFGSRIEGRHVQIVSAPAAGACGRVGFVVGRKVLARAVDRNRFKRLLREFLRSASSDIEPFDLVIRLKRPLTRDGIDEAAREAAALIRRAVLSRSPAASPP
jgi:ribonuclease P protein component